MINYLHGFDQQSATTRKSYNWVFIDDVLLIQYAASEHDAAFAQKKDKMLQLNVDYARLLVVC